MRFQLHQLQDGQQRQQWYMLQRRLHDNSMQRRLLPQRWPVREHADSVWIELCGLQHSQQCVSGYLLCQWHVYDYGLQGELLFTEWFVYRQHFGYGLRCQLQQLRGSGQIL